MVSARDRVAGLQSFGLQFKDHLLRSPGVALPATLRCAVVHEARHALIGCKACADLPNTVCLSPGCTSVFKFLDKMNHAQGDVMKTEETASDSAKKAIVNLVHTVVNHQGRLDQQWYSDTIQQLDDCRVLPDSIGKSDKRTYLLYSVFCEVVALVTVSLAIHVAFLGMGKEAPRLPTLAEMKQGKAFKVGPLYIDWVDLLHRAPRGGDDKCHSAYLIRGDVNTRSKEYPRFSPSTWKVMMSTMTPTDLYLGITMAGEDVVFVTRVVSLFYLRPSQIAMAFNSKLDPNFHCADNFSRRESELIAHHIAKAYGCGF